MATTATSAVRIANPVQLVMNAQLTTQPYTRPVRAIMGRSASRMEVAVAHAKDKGEKHVKKAAQRSVKEKRAAKRAKKEGTRPQHVTTSGE